MVKCEGLLGAFRSLVASASSNGDCWQNSLLEDFILVHCGLYITPFTLELQAQGPWMMHVDPLLPRYGKPQSKTVPETASQASSQRVVKKLTKSTDSSGGRFY